MGGIWGSYYNIPKAIFYLLKGDYTWGPQDETHHFHSMSKVQTMDGPLAWAFNPGTLVHLLHAEGPLESPKRPQGPHLAPRLLTLDYGDDMS